MAFTNLARIPLAQQFVRLGFGEHVTPAAPFRSLEFLTQVLTTTEAQQVIPVLPQYNQFDGRAVADGLETFRGRVSGWQFGCAGSPLLIAVLAPWTHQVEETSPRAPSGRKFSDTENETLIQDLRHTFLGSLGADKFEMNGVNKYEYGAWWD
jgi:hypothetical protein